MDFILSVEVYLNNFYLLPNWLTAHKRHQPKTHPLYQTTSIDAWESHASFHDQEQSQFATFG